MRDTKEYRAYLKSDIWKGKRQLVLDTKGSECENCGENALGNLQIHHVTYDRIYHEHIDDFEVLCGTCHNDHHIWESNNRKKRAAINTFMTKKYGEYWEDGQSYDSALEEFDDWLEEKEEY